MPAYLERTPRASSWKGIVNRLITEWTPEDLLTEVCEVIERRFPQKVAASPRWRSAVQKALEAHPLVGNPCPGNWPRCEDPFAH